MEYRDDKTLREIRQILKKDEEFRQKKEAEKVEALLEDTRSLYYAGIGSRQTPDYICDLMTKIAEKLSSERMVLRSGHAPGADQAFERGAGRHAQIFLPWGTFEQDVNFTASPDDRGVLQAPAIFDQPTQEARSIAARYHPMWDRLKPGAQALHARNSHQILGPKPLARPTPVEFVLCWTSDGQDSGGTGQAIRLARANDIPVYNLWNEDDYDMAFLWVYGD